MDNSQEIPAKVYDQFQMLKICHTSYLFIPEWVQKQQCIDNTAEHALLSQSPQALFVKVTLK